MQAPNVPKQITVVHSRALLKTQEQYQRIVNESVEGMIDNFHTILKSTQAGQDVSSGDFKISLHTTNIMLASEKLLDTIKDIKQGLIVNDHHRNNENIRNSVEKYYDHKEKTDSVISNCSKEMEYLLRELESEYYSSKYL